MKLTEKFIEPVYKQVWRELSLLWKRTPHSIKIEIRDQIYYGVWNKVQDSQLLRYRIEVINQIIENIKNEIN